MRPAGRYPRHETQRVRLAQRPGSGCDRSSLASVVASSWDDAVTMALNYAGIDFEKIWDGEVFARKLGSYDWLHLHHEDFTGQYSKFFLNYAGAPWLVEMVEQNRSIARSQGFATVPAEK